MGLAGQPGSGVISSQILRALWDVTFSRQVDKIVGQNAIKLAPVTQQRAGNDFHVAEEIRYIQGRAAGHHHCWLTLSLGGIPLALFATAIGDAWLLDTKNRLACQVAHNGVPQDVDIEEDERRYVITWRGRYVLDGDAFVYMDARTGRVVAFLGYPVRQIAALG
jgi:hypothetical protein